MGKVQICFHNDYYDQVCNDLSKYDYNLLFEIGYMSMWHRKKIFDYLFREFLQFSYNDVMLFKSELIDCNLYEEYVNSIINGNDKFLKTCLVLYFEKDLKEELFKDNKSLVNTIIDCDEDAKLILSNLLNVSQFICDDNTIKLIKQNMSKVLYEYYKDEDESYLKEILNNNFKIIDNNQEALKEEPKIILKRS